ncbi:MAG: hypothetical protein ACREHG_01300 [Candidatus Saccharimonadales bacterium]
MPNPTTIKENLIFIAKLWPIIACLASGFLYEANQVTILRVEVSSLQVQLTTISQRIDAILMQTYAQSGILPQKNK